MKTLMELLNTVYFLDKKGGALKKNIEEIPEGWKENQHLRWCHLDYRNQESQEWLKSKSGLDEMVVAGLLSEETRPRVIRSGNGLFITLRGVNLNPAEDPEDMVSIRMWLDEGQVISTGKRHLMSVQNIMEDLERGRGPTNTGEFLEAILDKLIFRTGEVVEEAEEEMDGIEETIIEEVQPDVRKSLASLRRQIISLRRYLAPQRDAMAKICSEKIDWLDEPERLKLRETLNFLVRQIEDLDAVREKASITHEELISILSDQLNKRMYVLSVIASVFLPLGFMTGLLGINVGGIPGSNYSGAFALFLLLLIAIAICQVILFRKKRWF